MASTHKWRCRVKFSTADEFLEELTKEAKAHEVDEDVVRVTFLHRRDNHTGIDGLSIYAGAVIRGKIMELRQYVGDLWSMSRDEKMKEKAEAIKSKRVSV